MEESGNFFRAGCWEHCVQLLVNLVIFVIILNQNAFSDATEVQPAGMSPDANKENDVVKDVEEQSNTEAEVCILVNKEGNLRDSPKFRLLFGIFGKFCEQKADSIGFRAYASS